MLRLKNLFRRKVRCPRKKCNYNNGRGKCLLEKCQYKNRPQPKENNT